jgi:hypothetical protein
MFAAIAYNVECDVTTNNKPMGNYLLVALKWFCVSRRCKARDHVTIKVYKFIRNDVMCADAGVQKVT